MRSDEGSWEECLEQNTTRAVTSDPARARSLAQTARARLAYLSRQAVDETSANFIFENTYSSLLEMIHAMCLQQGFKVSNHLCIGFFLRDVLRRDDLYRKFDQCRYRRNRLVYYGQRMDLALAEESIRLAASLIEDLQGLFGYDEDFRDVFKDIFDERHKRLER